LIPTVGSAAASSDGNHDLFVVFVTLHVVSAIIGSGAIALSGVYGGVARHVERAGAVEETRRWFATPNRLALLLLAVPFFGVGALLAGSRSAQLHHLWVVCALCVWLAMSGLLTGVVRPAERHLGEYLAARSDDGPGEGIDGVAVAQAARRCSLGAAACDLGFVIALGLMIWQP
jgi:hypothetical protein